VQVVALHAIAHLQSAWHIGVAAVEVPADAKVLYYLLTRAAQSQDVGILTLMPSLGSEPPLVPRQPDALMAGMHHSTNVPWLFPAAAFMVAVVLEGLGVVVATVIETRQRRIFLRHVKKQH
jgi:hypothetical protein